MRICHVTCVHKHTDGRIFMKECSSLAKVPGYEVFLACEGDSENKNNVTLIGNGQIPASRLKRMTSFAGKVVDSALSTHADVYHLHDPELLRHALKLKRTGAKVVFDSHENILDEIEEKAYLPVPVRKLAKLYYTILLNITLKRIDAVVIVTPQQEQGYRKLNKDIVLIPNYPILEEGPVETVEKEPGKIVFAGLISDLWSQKDIVKALDGIENVSYKLYGPVDEAYLEEMKQLPGWEKVTYMGVRPFDEVQKELKSANCALALLKPCRNTFYNEGTMGNTKLFEAMANETPVIATDFTLWEDVVNGNECGFLIDPNNEKDIHETIKHVLSLSAEEIKKLGANGRKAVVEKYSWQMASKALLDLYQRLQSK